MAPPDTLPNFAYRGFIIHLALGKLTHVFVSGIIHPVGVQLLAGQVISEGRIRFMIPGLDPIVHSIKRGHKRGDCTKQGTVRSVNVLDYMLTDTASD